jgi:hypothetical protein
MNNSPTREYAILDDDAARQQLIDRITETRNAVREIAQEMPQEQWYTPRYHGWSLAAMLGHLQWVDFLSKRVIQLGLMGITVPIPSSAWNEINTFMAGVFRRRVVETSLRSIEKNDAKIAAFIRNVPLKKFRQQVFIPPLDKTLTVEQAVQELFLYHWQDHLATLQRPKVIPYEPPESPNVV